MSSKLILPEGLMRVEKPVRLVVEVILAGLVAVMLAKVIWLAVAPQASVAVLQERPLPAPNAAAGKIISADRSMLVRSNPFSSDVTVVIPDAPATQLNLHLAGLIMSTGEFGGSAQITTPDNQMRRYTIGSDVLPGVKLERILSDRVILRRNGESETLMLGGRGAGLTVIGNQRQIGATSEASTVSVPQVIVGRLASPDVLMQTVQPSPVERDGTLYGYALSLRGSAETMANAGLAPGDILLEINGTPVSELDLNQIINEIGDQRIAVLSIERAGKLQTVRLRFNQ